MILMLMKNSISPFVYNLYIDKKLLNSNLIKTRIHHWVDNIFGKNQLPENQEEMAESCNIFSKLCYEQNINFEEKLEKYIKLLKSKKISEKELINKMKMKLDITKNLGTTPKLIVKTTNIYERNVKILKNINNNIIEKKFEDKLICFKKSLLTEEFIIIKDIIKKEKSKTRAIGLYTLNNKSLSEFIIFNNKQINLLKNYKSVSINFGNKKKKIPIYNPCYSISYLYLQTSKEKERIILSCRYLNNYFNIKTKEKSINVFCEDFVTCIKENNNYHFFGLFYTGLFNGKLIEWKLDSNFEVIRKKNIYAHHASITAIEYNKSQNIIITSSEDKYIHIRKQYDFELLTAIDLTYCFANPIVSQCKNIIPSLIKISDLNLIYVLIYDLDSGRNFIRGYNFNGLFFAQTEKEDFLNEKNEDILINSISFTKNSNLIIGFYNLNKYCLLQAWDLKPNSHLNNFKENEKKERFGTQMIEYDYYAEKFYVLYDNDFVVIPSKEIDI